MYFHLEELLIRHVVRHIRSLFEVIAEQLPVLFIAPDEVDAVVIGDGIDPGRKLGLFPKPGQV
jgi:hypothetical protein